MRYLRTCVLVATLAAPLPGVAETAYVTDQITTPLRADSVATAAVIKTIATGTALEVLERAGGVALVRDPQGVEGWIDVSLLSAQPPASAQIKTLRAELERGRVQLVQLQSQLDKARAAGSGSADADQLQSELTTTRTRLAETQRELTKSEQRLAELGSTPPVGQSGTTAPDGSRFSFLWLGIAFAMLVVGFVAGFVWVKESIRRRMGGLYLRI